MKDITQEAQKIISCIYHLHEQHLHFTAADLTAVLRRKKLKKYPEVSQLSTYGIMQDFSEKACLEIITYLVSTGLLSLKEQKILHLNRKSGLFLKEQQKLSMPVKKASLSGETSQEKGSPSGIDETLFRLLAKCRENVARKEHLPPYVVFTDMTLRDMCRKQPVSDMAFLSVSGVGRVKLEKYGDAFMTVIRSYRTA